MDPAAARVRAAVLAAPVLRTDDNDMRPAAAHRCLNPAGSEVL